MRRLKLKLDGMLTMREIGKLLRPKNPVSRQAVHELIKKGAFENVRKIGTRVYIPVQSYNNYVLKRAQNWQQQSFALYLRYGQKDDPIPANMVELVKKEKKVIFKRKKDYAKKRRP